MQTVFTSMPARQPYVAAPVADPLDLTGVPVRVDRRAGAALVTSRFFPISARTLEAWPLTWRRVNGRAVCETSELFAAAQAKLDAAPPIRGGRRPASIEA